MTRSEREFQTEWSWLVITGWVYVLLTPATFIIGSILAAKGRWVHGVAMIATSVAFWLLIIFIIASATTERSPVTSRDVLQDKTKITESLQDKTKITERQAYEACMQTARTAEEMHACYAPVRFQLKR